MLVGICGKSGSGKDTIADYLVYRNSFYKIALADPVRRIIKDVFVLSDHEIYDRCAREQPLLQWDDWSVRKLLQTIATELFRNNIDKDVWVKSLFLRIQSDPLTNYVIPDIRFKNELDYLKNKCSDFFSIKVKRNGFDGNVGIKEHESESYDLETDCTIENNGDFNSLYQKIDNLLIKQYT